VDSRDAEFPPTVAMITCSSLSRLPQLHHPINSENVGREDTLWHHSFTSLVMVS
jgi:hypothetical protein